MRNFKLLTYLSIISFIFFSCNVEEITSIEENNSVFSVTESNSNSQLGRYSYTEYCMETELMAGQHYNVGSVSTRIEEPNLIVTYTTVDGWYLDETHLTLGACDTGIFAGDKIKIGQFEHVENHGEGINQVSYSIDLSLVEDIYCFAAHASVISEDGKQQETAWANGESFGSNNGWKMYVEAYLDDCYLEDVVK